MLLQPRPSNAFTEGPNVEVRRSCRLAVQGKNEHDALCGQPVDVASTAELCAAPSTKPENDRTLRCVRARAPEQGTEGGRGPPHRTCAMHRGSATAVARRFGCPIVAAELGAKRDAVTGQDNDGELLIQQPNSSEKRDNALQQQR
jgi:hypothetical protein